MSMQTGGWQEPREIYWCNLYTTEQSMGFWDRVDHFDQQKGGVCQICICYNRIHILMYLCSHNVVQRVPDSIPATPGGLVPHYTATKTTHQTWWTAASLPVTAVLQQLTGVSRCWWITCKMPTGMLQATDIFTNIPHMHWKTQKCISGISFISSSKKISWWKNARLYVRTSAHRFFLRAIYTGATFEPYVITRVRSWSWSL